MNAKTKESSRVKKTRKRLEEQIASEHKRMTPQALNEMSKLIQKWILKHSEERVNLKTKAVALFDENRHSANPQNKFVIDLLKQIKQQAARPIKTLSGRVSIK